MWPGEAQQRGFSMKRIVSLAAVTAALLGVSGIAVAAQTPGTDVPAPAAAPTENAAPAAPAERIIGEFGPWTVICVEGSEPESCLARQTVDLAENGDGPKLYLFAERQGPEAPLVLTVGAPLGVSLQPGVSLLLNEGDSARVWHAPFETCLQEMCLAAAALNTDILAQAKSPFVSLSLPNNKEIGVQVGLATLGDAVEAMMAEKAKFPATADVPDTAEPAAGAKTPDTVAPANEVPATEAPASE